MYISVLFKMRESAEISAVRYTNLNVIVYVVINKESDLYCNGLSYEVSSIKNANPSIKFEGIKLQKCVIACKKGINVVVRFQYSEIS